MNQLYLPNHVYFCGRGNAFIFLDLKRDAYTMIRDASARAFSELIAGRLRQPDALQESLPLLDELLSNGLLTTDQVRGRKLMLTGLKPPTTVLLEQGAIGSGAISAGDVYRFFASCLKAKTVLRCRRIEDVVRSVARRRELRCPPGPICLSECRTVVAKFNRLRLLYPASYLCLFDSLALVEFMARYRLYPSWTFAVRFEPWAAHCWVQSEEVAFNEELENTQDFTPIMAV